MVIPSRRCQELSVCIEKLRGGSYFSLECLAYLNPPDAFVFSYSPVKGLALKITLYHRRIVLFVPSGGFLL